MRKQIPYKRRKKNENTSGCDCGLARRIGGEVTRPRNKPIKVFVTEAEREAITRKAAAANLSLSAYLRAAGLNHQVRSMMDIQTINELSKMHGKLRQIIIWHELEKDQELQDIQDMIHRVMGKGVR